MLRPLGSSMACVAIAGLVACSGSGGSKARPSRVPQRQHAVKKQAAAFPREAAAQCHPGGNWSKVPLAIPVKTGQGTNPQGYMRRNEFCGSYHGSSQPIPVYEDALVTLVGHMYTNRGFVSAGTDARTVPCFSHGFTSTKDSDGAVVTSRVPQTCDPPYEGR